MVKGVNGFQGPQASIPPNRSSKSPQGTSFSTILQTELNGKQSLRWSAHAQARLNASKVTLSPSDMARLHDAVNKASNKGARESLILMDNLALVVSIKNRTVITAIGTDRLKDNVFTNIDSAVIT